MLALQLVPNEPRWLLLRYSFQARVGNGPRGRETGRGKKKKDEKGAGFKWSSLAHGSHERSLPTEETWTHTHTLRLRQA